MNRAIEILCRWTLLAFVPVAPVAAEEITIPGPLPEPISNNAVAEFTLDEVHYVMSFMGLGPGKTYADISRRAWLWTSETRAWKPFPDVPVERGRLASVAVGLYDRVLLFGGYTVAEDGGELSTPQVFIINPADVSYQRRADMPLPVDDTVAFAYANRYIYLVSGWHDSGNVPDVQLYDTWEDLWSAATAFPGIPVFGHAGGLVGNQIIVAGGVGVLGEVDGKRRFGAIDQAWRGVIDPDDPTVIDWQSIPGFDGTDRYRMAAVGDAQSSQVIFAGGTDRPYNFDGIGYDGLPAEPTAAVFAYDLSSERWVAHEGAKSLATMDHRGLLEAAGVFFTLGGMGEGQQVLSAVSTVEIPQSRPEQR